MRLKISEAVLKQREKGKKVTNIILAERVFGKKTRSSHVMMSRLRTGRSSWVKIDWIPALCKELEITPNYLFGYKDKTADE